MRTCHRGSLIITVGTVRQGTQYAILLTIVFQTTRGCHINPLATVGIISHASVRSHGTNSHNLVKTTRIIVAFLTIVTGSKDTETTVHLVATTILGEVIYSLGNRLILIVCNTGRCWHRDRQHKQWLDRNQLLQNCWHGCRIPDKPSS